MAIAEKPRFERRPFGATADGGAVELFTLCAGGLEAEITSYGAIVTALRAPDRAGRLADVVLGYPSLAGYLESNPYFGAIVGRYGNRIAAGRFALDGRDLQLACNDGPNHLHGGVRGFDKVRWTARPYLEEGRAALELGYQSADGEEGYPGRLSARVTYALTAAGELAIEYEARSDRRTICNLTHHGYWNLDGAGSGDVLRHRLTLMASRFTPVGPGLIPTGALADVAGTPFDFRRPTPIGARIAAADPQLAFAGGYDHNFVVDRGLQDTARDTARGDARGDAGGGARDAPGLVLAARLEAATSGRVMEVLTTEPGIQFYSGNFLDGSITGKEGVVYRHRTGLCLETQHFPDSPNQPSFPSTVLEPGATYRSSTVYRFSVA